MKKLFLIMAISLIAFASNGQMLIKQIAFGAKGVDSLVGGAPAGGTAKYYYFNVKETVAAGQTVSTTSMTNYQIFSVTINITVPTKAADVCDSNHVSLELSNDNVNWFKWKNVASSTTQYLAGAPLVSGSGVYRTVPAAAPLDVVYTGTTAGGAMFLPNMCYAPYARLKIVSFKASSSAYAKVYFALKPINN
jgi:hypothetical protein